MRWVISPIDRGATVGIEALSALIDAQNRHSKTDVDHVAPNTTVLGQSFVDWLLNNFGWMFAQAQVNATLGQSYDDTNLGSTPILLGKYCNGSSSFDGRRAYIWLPIQDGQAIPIGLYRSVGSSASTLTIWAHPEKLPTPTTKSGTLHTERSDWTWPGLEPVRVC